MRYINDTPSGKKIDKLSPKELRDELREALLYAAKLEKGVKCMHEDMESVSYAGTHEAVRLYTCRSCGLSWSDNDEEAIR